MGVSPQSPPSSSSSNNNNNGFPTVAIALLGISAITFLLISYYIFITNKCCFRNILYFRQHTNNNHNETLTPSSSPSYFYTPSRQSQGLDDQLIRQLPTFQYRSSRKKSEGEEESNECIVCLNEFHDCDVLRYLPKCGHSFHLDCIDVWLLNSSNCPICRSAAVSGRKSCPEDYVAPSSSPRDFVVIEMRGEVGIMGGNQERGRSNRSDEPRKSRKHSRRSLMIVGEERIDVKDIDEPIIRRSFSMDSMVDRISRSRRILSSFRQGGGSRNAVRPIVYE